MAVSSNTEPAAGARLAAPVKSVPPKTASLFDLPGPAAVPADLPAWFEEGDEALVAIDDDEPIPDAEELDDPA